MKTAEEFYAERNGGMTAEEATELNDYITPIYAVILMKDFASQFPAKDNKDEIIRVQGELIDWHEREIKYIPTIIRMENIPLNVIEAISRLESELSRLQLEDDLPTLEKYKDKWYCKCGEKSTGCMKVWICNICGKEVLEDNTVTMHDLLNDDTAREEKNAPNNTHKYPENFIKWLVWDINWDLSQDAYGNIFWTDENGIDYDIQEMYEYFNA